MNTQIDKTFFEVPEPLPNFPASADRATVKTVLVEYATRNNFVMIICKSDAKSLIFQCKKSGTFKQTRDTELHDRKRVRSSCKDNCPCRIKFTVSKTGVLKHKVSVNENENFHNHFIDEEPILSIFQGRKNKLNIDDEKKFASGYKQKATSTAIQKSISANNSYFKITVHDLNNLKYASKKDENVAEFK